MAAPNEKDNEFLDFSLPQNAYVAFDAVSLTQIITPVLADLATSAAAIAALND